MISLVGSEKPTRDQESSEMARIKKRTHEELVDELASMGINRFLNTVMEANEKRKTDLAHFIADAIAIDLQSNMEAHGIEPTCPECGSTDHKKDGKRGEIQRYKCRQCGTRYTAFTNTLLDKSRYTWSVWVEVLYGMLLGRSVLQTRQTLIDDYKCVKIDPKTIWLMRLKIMNAISKVPSPTLRGVIQMDDTFLREDQKGSRHLVNPIPDDINGKRKPRYTYIPSQLGTRGNEFTTITTAIDNTGHCVCRLMCCGPVPDGLVYDFIDTHMEDISFVCTDRDDTYIRVLRAMGIAHYARPSAYTTIIKKHGYISPSPWDPEEVIDRVKEANDRVLERLWQGGLIDDIRNRGKMTYKRFVTLKKDNGLNLAQVNELHKDLKNLCEREMTGVSSKYLSLYVAWFEYMKNRAVDVGHPLTSRKEAEDILVEAVRQRTNLTTARINEIRSDALDLPKASGRYIRLLEANTRKIQVALSDLSFCFSNEDGVSTFKTQNILWSLPDAKIRELAKRLKIKGWGSASRTTLIEELKKRPDLDDHLLIVAVNGNGSHNDGTPHIPGMPYDYNHNRSAPASVCMEQAETTPLQAARYKRKVIFLDVETTGTNMKSDEILQIAIANADGELLYASYIKPIWRKRWDKAAEVNGITSDMVIDAPTTLEAKEEIEAVLADCDVICGWNVQFDLRMIHANWINIPENARWCDLMPAFASAWKASGLADKGYGRLRREKLTNATEWLGIDHNPHSAVSDTLVLPQIWDWVVRQGDPKQKKPKRR